MSLRNARTSSMICDVVLAHDEFELTVPAALDDVDEGLDRKSVMLGRDGKARLGRAAVLVAGLEHIGLLYDLTRMAQKLGAVVGERDAAAGARKDLQMELLFQAFDGVLRCWTERYRGAELRR